MKLLTSGMRTVVFATTLLCNLMACRGDENLMVPPGFRVEHFADDDLAHDIQSMAIDSQGRVVVSGPGYIRILIDSDGDGKADQAKQFADGPEKGAQGLYFMGPHLLCSGGNGLMIYRDENKDDKADGPATTFLKIKAGGEHHVHSIQRGPDGWWYVIAGNMAGVDDEYAVLPTSPIEKPEAGVLLRLQPDLSTGEVVADGFRNAYDFAFGHTGDVFTFDSDGERDVSLPWYRPCRVFHVMPRSHAGWVSRSWKHPNDFASMPPTVAEFGRASPTGVVCYRHSQFPSRYQNSLFVLDWTFGRILTLSLSQQQGLWKASPAVFAKGRGNFGFAPTDIEVGPNGGLFVSVGGRGTRGSVFRIVSDLKPPATLRKPGTDRTSKLEFVLQSPQPESSWSRETWLPVAVELEQSAFIKAALDEGRRPEERIRAIEVMVSTFDGIDGTTAQSLAKSRSAAVRARTAWAVGRSNAASPDKDTILTLLNDNSSLVRRSVLEALVCVTDSALLEQCLPGLAAGLGASNRGVRWAAGKVMSRLTVVQQEQLLALLNESLPAQVRLLHGVLARKHLVDAAIAKLAVQSLQAVGNSQDKIDALRLLQLAMGDVGPAKDVLPALESYTSIGDLSGVQQDLGNFRSVLAKQFPSGNPSVDRELVRTIAIVGSDDANLLSQMFGQITATSNPVDDIHNLAAIARMSAKWAPTHVQAAADALVNLDAKIIEQSLKQDSNWDDRVGEIFGTLCEANSTLPVTIASSSKFGLPGHVVFLKNIPAKNTQAAINGFANRIDVSADYSWSTDVVFVLGNSTNPKHRELIRSQADNPAVADAVFTVLGRKPDVLDRAIYVRGLDSSLPKAVEACVSALLKLPRSNSAKEQFQLIALAKRLTHTPKEFVLRESVIRLLQNNTSESLDFVFGKDGHQLQSEAIGRWEDFLAKRYPQSQPKLQGGLVAERVLEALPEVRWAEGDVARGKQLYTKLTCARCHGGRKAMGPDLQGVAKRFSRHDLFASIVDPNRDVSNRYQMTTVETKGGKTYSGLVVYESVDGILLRDSDHDSFRIVADDIQSKVKRRTSLMPAGLLRTVSRQDLADLDAYLRQL